jgi:hypothetical protein
MTRYGKPGSKSGVVAFEVLETGIILQFRDGGRYLYTHNKPGEPEVEEMKRLAAKGRGLATYVNKNVRDLYVRKL